MYKNVIFDCSDTLLRMGAPALLKQMCGDERKGEELYKSIFLSDAWWDYDCGRIDVQELAEILIRTAPGEHKDFLKRHIDEFLTTWYKKYTPIEGIKELVEELKGLGVKIYLLSDFPACIEYVWAQFPEIFSHFDGRVVSYEVGTKKPEGVIFGLLLDKYGLATQECLFVDDTQICIDQAEKVGIPAHRFIGVADLRKALGL